MKKTVVNVLLVGTIEEDGERVCQCESAFVDTPAILYLSAPQKPPSLFFHPNLSCCPNNYGPLTGGPHIAGGFE